MTVPLLQWAVPSSVSVPRYAVQDAPVRKADTERQNRSRTRPAAFVKNGPVGAETPLRSVDAR